jgi:hypothetical protein
VAKCINLGLLDCPFEPPIPRAPWRIAVARHDARRWSTLVTPPAVAQRALWLCNLRWSSGRGREWPPRDLHARCRCNLGRRRWEATRCGAAGRLWCLVPGWDERLIPPARDAVRLTEWRLHRPARTALVQSHRQHARPHTSLGPKVREPFPMFAIQRRHDGKAVLWHVVVLLYDPQHPSGLQDDVKIYVELHLVGVAMQVEFLPGPRLFESQVAVSDGQDILRAIISPAIQIIEPAPPTSDDAAAFGAFTFATCMSADRVSLMWLAPGYLTGQPPVDSASRWPTGPSTENRENISGRDMNSRGRPRHAPLHGRARQGLTRQRSAFNFLPHRRWAVTSSA